MLISLMIFVILSVVAAYFASNNMTVIDVSLLGYPIKGTTGTLIVSALGFGVLLGVLMMLPALISRSWAVIRHRRKLQDLQDQQLRSQRKDHVEDTEEN